MERDTPLGKKAQIKGKQGLSLFYIKWKYVCLLSLDPQQQEDLRPASTGFL